MDLRALYSRGLKRFELGSVAGFLLNRVLAGDDCGADFEEALRRDRFFTAQMVRTAGGTLKKGELKSVSHAVVLLGQEMVRDFVLGHTARRLVDSEADKNFSSMSHAQGVLKKAKIAEELARNCQCDYTGVALVSGYVFDIFEQWMLADPQLGEAMTPFLEKTWQHGIRTAVIAWGLATHERIKVNLKKIVFGSGLLHDVGKLLLACVEPEKYKSLFAKMNQARELIANDDFPEIKIEREVFELAHTEVGSFLMAHIEALHEMEGIVDYHHDFAVLKTRDPDLFILSVVINIADRIAFLMETKNPPEETDLEPILEPHAIHYPLSSKEITNVLIALRAKNILT